MGSIEQFETSSNFWSTFKKLDKNYTTTQEEIPANTWFEYYQHLNSNHIPNKHAHHQKLKTCEENAKDQDLLDDEISISDIKKHISKLKLNKSNGPDLISNEMLKYGKELLAASIQNLFNLILKTGIYPKAWKKV